MPSKPRTDLKANTAEFERHSFIKPTGFREYDARWVFGEEINLMGIHQIGIGMAELFKRRGVPLRIVVGHDYRSYSSSIKYTLISGLLAGGMEVFDIGLALSPTAYFAQFELEVEGVAMVTASHNDNGWTGIKMGLDRPLTFGPEEMTELKEIVLDGVPEGAGGGIYHTIDDMSKRFIANLTNRPALKRKLKVVCACGNGTAAAFAPQVLKAIGCEVIELNCDLDYNFPNHNPNPEDMKMLHAMRDAVLEHKADIALGFDGDGDRCGVVDNLGEEIFSDKIGLMLARDISKNHENAKFVVDVKSTGLFLTDPVLKENGATTDYWKTGHSYIKRYSHDHGCLVGFEKSGHFFFNKPLGFGYDCGLTSGLAVLDLLDHNSDKTMNDLYGELQTSYQSPTMSPHCPDELKYGVVDRVIAHFEKYASEGGTLGGQNIKDLITVNGIRMVMEDGSWGLVRASSNTPQLVVVIESTTSDEMMRAIFKDIDAHLSTYEEIGEYNQKL
jgi:phosphomannomutase / phosphoglucomutase